MTGLRRTAASVGLVVLLSGCLLSASPTPTPRASAAATTTPSPAPSGSTAPTATPEPSFSIALPDGTDDRAITVAVAQDMGAEGGELVVTVTNTTDQRIDELVLRWATELNDTLFLAPFVPSEDRIRDGGPPLVQAWTKWVIGPGERGEPAGTISLGYGPLMPGATLAIALNAERRTPGSVSFDLQVLADNDLLALADGGHAALRIEVP
jgi:hypothetical protein